MADKFERYLQSVAGNMPAVEFKWWQQNGDNLTSTTGPEKRTPNRITISRNDEMEFTYDPTYPD